MACVLSLVQEALQDLHRDLLEGLREWSERLVAGHLASGVQESRIESRSSCRLQDCSEIEARRDVLFCFKLKSMLRGGTMWQVFPPRERQMPDIHMSQRASTSSVRFGTMRGEYRGILAHADTGSAKQLAPRLQPFYLKHIRSGPLWDERGFRNSANSRARLEFGLAFSRYRGEHH